MRVIGGKLRGKLIHNPTDKTTRPLKDMVRESIFNILEHSKNEKIKFKNDVVLDLFSGSGSFGIECLSRGVKKVFFFENYKPSLKILEKNIKELEIDKDSVIREINAYDLFFIPFSRQSSMGGLTIVYESGDLFVNGISNERK